MIIYPLTCNCYPLRSLNIRVNVSNVPSPIFDLLHMQGGEMRISRLYGTYSDLLHSGPLAYRRVDATIPASNDADKLHMELRH